MPEAAAPDLAVVVPRGRGLFVTLEGGEGVGKSTQARRLADALAAGGLQPLHTREPGGAPGAERLRALLLAGDHGLGLHAETLLHVAARFDHLEHTVRPALAADRLVICDRFHDSTLAYQGYGLGQGDPQILAFIRTLIGITPLAPDLTLLLDLPREQARVRLRKRGRDADRYERLDEAFHDRVAAGYREIALAEPGRIRLIDATGTVGEVHQRLLDVVADRLLRHTTSRPDPA